jgi:excisionase family DNA binding protein
MREAGFEDSQQLDILMTRKEAAKYLGFKTNTLAVWACNKRYDLKPVKIGRSVRYKKSVLDKFRESGLQPE